MQTVRIYDFGDKDDCASALRGVSQAQAQKEGKLNGFTDEQTHR